MRYLRSLVVTLLVSLAATWAVSSVADGPVTSSIMVPVDGQVFSPGGTFESVALTGRMHLVTQYLPQDPCIPTDPCRVFLNLADVKGIGLRSASTYIAIGAVMAPCSPGDPCRAQFTFMPVSVPPNPIIPPTPIMPIAFEVQIAFDATGHLSTDGTIVRVEGCTTDLCR